MGNLWKRLPIPIIVLTACALQVEAQYFRNSNYWKTHRNELTIGLGASNFLGELGGRDQIGSPFIWDLELSQTKPTLSVGFRYYTFEKQALRANLAYRVLAGNDNLTSEPFRQDRNLNFRSDLFEFSLVYEIHFFKEQLGHIYDLQGVSERRAAGWACTCSAGSAASTSTPRPMWVAPSWNCNPEHRGQGLPDGPEEYTLYQIGIPWDSVFGRASASRSAAGSSSNTPRPSPTTSMM